MGKSETVYTCTACGHAERKWVGKCPSCSAWNSMIEEVRVARPSSAARGRAPDARPAARAVPITAVGAQQVPRVPLGLGDVDRVLGGGLVPGSLVLVGGEPGVGKSTLFLTMAKRLAQSGVRTLYVSAEESPSQTRLRAERLGALDDELFLLAETDLAVALDEVARIAPRALVLDSVQTLYVPELDAAPGSVSQVREVTSRVMHLAKQQDVTTLLVGHVTKEGAIAGPKTLEHMVDAVMSFEHMRAGPHRVLRAHKNRFGSTNEIAVFEMRGAGLVAVAEPSALFLAERPRGRPGSVVGATMEGTRPVLCEVQGLCVATPFGNPRRTTQGFDTARLAMLAAVLERRCGLSLAGHDLFVNVAGGVSVVEPAADLPAALAVASSLKNRAVDPDLCCIGEVGLAGEVRAVERLDARLHEAQRMGFLRALVPAAGVDTVAAPPGLVLMPVRSLDEALDAALVGVAPNRPAPG